MLVKVQSVSHRAREDGSEGGFLRTPDVLSRQPEYQQCCRETPKGTEIIGIKLSQRGTDRKRDPFNLGDIYLVLVLGT